MSDNSSNTAISDDIEVVGPGQMLKDARVELGLNEQDVAIKLNLRASTIEEIENDCFDEKTPVTFIRGYLKNYARLVDVSYDDVKIAYETLDVAKRHSGEMKSFSQDTRKKAENNRLMLIIYLMIFILIGLTVVWWLQETSKDGVDIQAPTNTTATAELQSTEQGVSKPEPIAVEHDENSKVELIEETKEIAVFTSEEHVQTLSQPNPLALDSLVLSFSGDCWVNIFDATGERLAWGIKKADYVMSLEGKAPFTITLGKPELVSIDYNQEAVNMTQFQKGQIAKFTWPIQ